MNDPHDQAGAMPADDLAALAAEAAGLEAGAAPAGTPGAPATLAADAAAAANAAAEARELVNLAGSLLLPLVPEPYAKCYGPTELQRIGDALGAVAHKRGWSMGDMLAGWGPEIALVAACAGPILPVVLAEAKKRRDEAAKPPGAAIPPPPEPAAPPPGDHHLAGERVMPELEGQRVL